MKNSLFILLILCLSLSTYGQKKTDANINGHVVNKGTGEHVPYINISLKGTTIGVTTDGTGHYFLKNLPVGNCTLVASGIGYKTVEKALKLVSGKTLEVNFEIDEDKIQLDAVVVTANRNEVNRKESPSIVNVINPRVFETTNSVCLAQGLNYQPGLRVETNCQN